MATTKITKGESFPRAIDYDLENGRSREDREKISMLPATENEILVEGFKAGRRARLLETNLTGDTPAEFAEQFDNVAAQKPGKKEPVHKVSISLKHGEHLEIHEWLEVAHSYLDEMGYADCPYLIAQHREKDHEHIHIVTSKVDFNGNVVSDSFEQRRARTWARGIEEKYDLHRTAERAAEKGLTRIEIEQSIKTKSPPPKLILQESIKKTLAANQETPDFLDALHRQNISVMVRTNEQKQIIGISFAIGGRAFKGSTLGTNYTWNGLQKGGLNYEFERDYERLEETSRRSSRTKSERVEPAALGTSADSAEQIDERTAKRSWTEDVQIISGGTESDYRIESGRSNREKITGKPIERLESGDETGLDFSSVESASLAAESDERFAEKGDRESETGNQGELRRVERFHRGEDETAQRGEPEVGETTAAEETDAEAPARRRSIDWLELDEEEYFREQQSKQQAEFFEQSSVNYLLPAETGQQIDTAAPPTGADLRGAGDSSAPLVANIRIDQSNDSGNLSNNSLAVDPAVQNNVVDVKGVGLDGGGNAGSPISSGDSCNWNSGLARSGLGNNSSDEYSSETVAGDSLNLSAKLRSSLENAESTAKKTVELHDEVVAEDEKQKQLEAKYEDVELEIELGQGLSM